MKRAIFLAAIAAFGFSAAAQAQSVKGDAAAGQALFKMQCAMCHAVVAGKNGLGPNLARVFNRKPAAVTGFNYSPAMKAMPGKWDAAALEKYLSAPSVALPGTKMVYAGQKDAKKRGDLIAYLATLK